MENDRQLEVMCTPIEFMSTPIKGDAWSSPTNPHTHTHTHTHTQTHTHTHTDLRAVRILVQPHERRYVALALGYQCPPGTRPLLLPAYVD